MKTKILYFILSISVIPFILYINWGIVDPYLRDHVAYSIRMLQDNIELNETPFRHIPAYGAFIGIIIELLGLYPGAIIYLPIGAIAFILSGLLIINLLGKDITSYAFILLIAFGFAAPYYSIWSHGIGYALFLFGLYTLYKILFHDQQKFEYLVCLLLIGINIVFFSYTTSVWLIVTTGVIAILIRQNVGRATPILLITLFLGLNQILYDSVLPKISLWSNELPGIIDRLFDFSQEEKTILSPYYYYMKGNLTTKIITILYLVLLFLPVFTIKKMPRNIQYFAIAILLAGFISTLIYLKLGFFTMHYYLLTLPFLVLIFLRSFEYKIRKCYAFSLVALCVAMFYLNMNQGLQVKHISHSTILPVYAWHAEYLPDTKIITDHHTEGIINIFSALDRITLRTELYTLNTFSYLFEPTRTEKFNSVWIINKSIYDKRTWAGGWRDFKPIKGYYGSLFANSNLSVLYDNGYTNLFKKIL